ncbi:MAG: glycosyltransferase family 2 protein [Pseudonocardia sp.]|jgi:glycosyltransferase involved in cell wall biosynthesis|uniref:glycosyltransferase family 2 protein n=1 Tax=Pseudonocardia sp. TaxID=60912 RepID=UPI00262C4A34|nr:glycosyltransferase family 2 protein [Pseudonocardia sp.]MCU1631290.1 glycosyltransferase family 2 protein [Pseudonocardia sp.]
MTTVLDQESTEPGPVGPAAQYEAAAKRWPTIGSVSIVIPALNEEENLGPVMATIPYDELAAAGCDLEVIVIDNASTDATAEVAVGLGATVYLQPARGYGNAYHTGFAVARGDVIATGDADCTYPFDALPGLLDHMHAGKVDFLSTNRLNKANRAAMRWSHLVANHVLTAANRGVFSAPFADSQSGMWVFRREIWRHLDVRSGGMAFSQEIKNEAYVKGFRCDEVPIEYRRRGGEVKLNALRDGTINVSQLAGHRFRARRTQVALRRLAEPMASLALPRPHGIDVPVQAGLS